MPDPALGWGWLTHHRRSSWDREPILLQLCWGRGAAWKGLVTSQGDTHAASPIPSLAGEILLSVTRYKGLHKAVTAGNWCPGLLIAFCLLPNP